MRVLRHLVCAAAVMLVATSPTASSGGGAFKGNVISSWQGDGKRMELLEPFGYVDPRGRHWDVPKGTVVDGATIPRILWSIVGAPFTGKYRKASVLHDFYCDSMTRSWQEVHRMFYEASLTEGNSSYHAKVMYAAVYTWGPRWIVVDGIPMRIREAMLEPTERELRGLVEWIEATDPTLEQIASFSDHRFPRRTR